MNIISLNRLLKKGFKVQNEEQVIIMEQKKLILKFDRTLRTSGTNLRGISMVPKYKLSMITNGRTYTKKLNIIFNTTKLICNTNNLIKEDIQVTHSKK